MTKEKLQAAINAMLNGKDKGFYHDELSTLLTLVAQTDEAGIAAAWSEISKV